MSKGSTRRPENRVAIEKNWPFPTWTCTGCGTKAIRGGPDGSWHVCPNDSCPDKDDTVAFFGGKESETAEKVIDLMLALSESLKKSK